ncbi:glutaminyl-peptide cyclotransferase-like [Homalodisca vitripennis]|uniref:glutaminyl-peptide cyclotransferase-like n=1 Tax=Homalodisca vitripennis TaxID=197043 RepID=UPI001EEC7F75|nr:glutaminyl-peptide cyclotransferase-like [Homalodisca vitripennis]
MMGLILNTFFVLYLFNFFEKGNVSTDFHLKKAYHEPRALKNDAVSQIAGLSNMERFDKILTKILVPRVVGTESHQKVREYIMGEMKNLDWTVETQVSEQNTPLGQLTFTNIVARLNPSADRYLVLACHYDSKKMHEGAFLGATDSAVPCAMMIDLAYALQDSLEQFKKSELSLMFVFFDGEEAFVEWGPDDSIYGARSLANMWEQNKYPEITSSTDHLDRMDLLVLLDLLGAPRPTFFSYFKKTNKWYLQMVSAERRLTDLGLLKKKNNEVYFYKMHLTAHIEDDHIPFLHKDVPCLHVIPTPFPDCWHKMSDNRNALDFDTIDNLNKILRVFVLEYLKGTSRSKRSADTEYPEL